MPPSPILAVTEYGPRREPTLSDIRGLAEMEHRNHTAPQPWVKRMRRKAMAREDGHVAPRRPKEARTTQTQPTGGQTLVGELIYRAVHELLVQARAAGYPLYLFRCPTFRGFRAREPVLVFGRVSRPVPDRSPYRTAQDDDLFCGVLDRKPKSSRLLFVSLPVRA